MNYRAILFATAGAAFASWAPAMALAQAGTSTIEEVVVTARKTEEKLINTPVTVTALTAARIDAKGLSDFRNIASNTPGININPSFSGRWATTTVFRAMKPSISANTSLFIDGTPVTSQVVELAQDSERVEVLKGPETAYFGRSTFAGAINFVTKAPPMYSRAGPKPS